MTTLERYHLTPAEIRLLVAGKNLDQAIATIRKRFLVDEATAKKWLKEARS